MKYFFKRYVINLWILFLCILSFLFVSLSINFLADINDLKNQIIVLQEKNVFFNKKFDLEKDKVLMENAIKQSQKHWSHLATHINIFSIQDNMPSLVEISLKAKEFVREIHQMARDRKRPVRINPQELFGLNDLIQYRSAQDNVKAIDSFESFSITQYLLSLLIDSNPSAIDTFVLEDVVNQDNILNKKKIILSFSGDTHTLRDFINGLSGAFFIKKIKINKEHEDFVDLRSNSHSSITQIISNNASSFFVELLLLKVKS